MEANYPIKNDPSLFRKVVYDVCPNFIITENNRYILNELFNYTQNKGIFEQNKGIWLFGDVGTGKSTLMRILAEYQRKYNMGFKCVNCQSIVSAYSARGIDELEESTTNRTFGVNNPVERGFDELGRETIPAKYFGNELNIMQYIIQLRYDLKVKTHVTTNINPEDIEKLYGSFIYDRCIEMFNFIELKGESFR